MQKLDASKHMLQMMTQKKKNTTPQLDSKFFSFVSNKELLNSKQ